MQIWEAAAVAALALINIIGFAVCAADKWAAVMRRWRVPEKALFALALFGGAAGVYIAMLIFSHKTQKRRFTILMPLILMAQAAIVIWVLWPVK